MADPLTELTRALEPLGMFPRGGFVLDAADAEALAPFPALHSSIPERTLVMVGNAGPALYRAFFAVVGENPAGPHPLDSWTRDVIAPIAGRLGARAGFPFGGPPWLPFQRWAKRAEGLQASPLGVLIHPDYGLWHAYRAALIFDGRLEIAPLQPAASPCDSCAGRPCLTTCPVDAVTPAGYQVGPCARHVAGATGADCRSRGCLARRACPVGREYRYPDSAMAFHMGAFLAARRAEGSLAG